MRNIQTNNQITKQGLHSGFTIIETLVAITILMIAIAGPLSIANRGLRVAQDSKEQMTALYLAQTQLEYLKNIRDTDLENSNSDTGKGSDSASWLIRVNPTQTSATDTGGWCTAPSWCAIDTSIAPSSSLGGNQCNLLGCDRLYFHPTKYYYTYSPSVGAVAMQPTTYRRKYQVVMKSGVGGGPPFDEAEVIVKVSWNTPGGARDFILKSSLFNGLR